MRVLHMPEGSADTGSIFSILEAAVVLAGGCRLSEVTIEARSQARRDEIMNLEPDCEPHGRARICVKHATGHLKSRRKASRLKESSSRHFCLPIARHFRKMGQHDLTLVTIRQQFTNWRSQCTFNAGRDVRASSRYRSGMPRENFGHSIRKWWRQY